MRRRRNPDGPGVPRVLAQFSAADWPGMDGLLALQAWHAARLSWHDGNRLPPPRDYLSPLGSMVDVFRGYRSARRGLAAARCPPLSVMAALTAGGVILGAWR